jgi:L-arabinonolactonase
MSIEISFYGDHRNKLGESPIWDTRCDRLFWVDSMSCKIFSADAQGGDLKFWQTPAIVGSIALSENGLIAALADGFYSVDLDTGAFTPVALPEAGNDAVRFNDGKADRQGRFLSGTMRHGEQEGAPGKLYRLEDGTAHVIEDGIMLSNSLCFSPDGKIMYFADSLQSCIWAYDYLDDAPIAASRRQLIDTTAHGSAPDGATVDLDGHLWVAFVQNDKLVRISPEGKIVDVLVSPVPYPSCPAFGGVDLATMYVTSLWDTGGMFKTDHVDGGRMLAISGLPANGIAEVVCAEPVAKKDPA